MATVKIKFRSSSVDGREGTVYYQVIHKRVARQINTPYKLFPAEWSKQHSRIIITPSDEGRRQYLLSLDKKISEDTDRLENVITALGRKGGAFTADDVTSAFHGNHCGLFFFVFMREVIDGLERLGKIRLHTQQLHAVHEWKGHATRGYGLRPDDRIRGMVEVQRNFHEHGLLLHAYSACRL